MVTEQSLSGSKVLVTRPENQSEALSESIHQNGGEAILFPVIAIEGIDATHWWRQDIVQQDWLIFISRNAVEHFMTGLKAPLPETMKYAVVGDGTAETLRSYGLQFDAKPVGAVGSEGLLANAVLQNIAGKNIIIVRGKGGRELLADTLQSRGANISYIEVYQRVLASPTAKQFAQAQQANLLVCTSAVGVDNLCELLANDEQLKTKPLLVLSERIRQHALSLGFSSVLVTTDASDSAIMDGLREMNKHHGN